MGHNTASLPTATGGEPHFALECDPNLLGFERLEVTARQEFEDGYQMPTEVRVIFPDGSELEDVPADAPAFTLRALHRVHGLDIVVPIERAWHIKHLHIDGAEPGSVFREGTTLRSALAELCEVLPLEASEGNFTRQTFNVDAKSPIGYERHGTFEELREMGLITGMDERIIARHWREWVDINMSSDDAKCNYVERFNRGYRGQTNIFLGIIRPPGNAVLPMVAGDWPEITTQVMTALSTRRRRDGNPSYRKMHTYTPGRSVAPHPLISEHRNPETGTVSKGSLRDSVWKWSHNLMVVPPDEDS